MKAINKSLTLSSFPDWMISFLLPIYCTGLGFSPAQTTRMFALHSLFLLLGKLVSGRLCDRVGRRVVFLAGLVLMSGAYLLLAFAQGAALLYSSQVLDGAASALLAVSTYAMLADRSGENMAIDRGRQSAASNRGALYGVFLYFMLLTWLGFGQGWKAFFLLCAVLTLLGAANNYKDLPADQGTAVQPSAPKMDWRALLASRVGGLLAVRTLMALALNMLGAVVVLVMMGRFGEDMMLIGLTCLLPSCLLTWLMPKIGAQVKRIGERKAFLCCGVLALFFLAFLANSRQPVSFGLGWAGYQVAVTGLCLSIDAVFSFSITEKQEDASSPLVGQLSGLYSCSINLGSTISALVSGLLLERFGDLTPFLVTAVLLALTVLAFWKAAGGPDGGDGGRGGNVVLQGCQHINTLVDFQYKRKFVAQNGQNGSGNRCYGKSAPDLIIKVPVGTVVKNAESGQIMADIADETPVIIAHGGKGGWGNSHFASPTRQIPRYAKPGLPGESFELILELKLLADVGLVGYPNVGKSTLISVVSGAKPVIANYHFTTLTPVLGVVKVAEEKSFVMADIPGLIEGASDGVGLGHEFLRHVERCRLIVHVVDVSGSEYRDPKEDFKTINRELANFSEELSKRDQIVVANKSDIATEEQIEDFRQFVEEQGYPFFCISAATRKGIEPLVYAISQKLDELPPIKRFEVNYVPVMPESGEDKWKFEIHVDEDGVYVVEADWLVKVLGMVNLEDEESLGYFQRVLRQSGIIDKLEEMGINEGDTVSILNFEFDYLR